MQIAYLKNFNKLLSEINFAIKRFKYLEKKNDWNGNRIERKKKE